MASDEEELLTRTSYISALTLKVKNMLKKPTLDSQLSETLDSFLTELSRNSHYLANGIFNIKFAEAGLFLENSANLYGKRVDLLWDNALQYQMQLCTYNKSQEENAKEAEKITQRINRNKRKKVIQNAVEKLPFFDELVNDISRGSKVLDVCSTLTPSDQLNNNWKDISKNKTVNNHCNGDSTSQRENQPSQRSPCSDFVCSVNQSVYLDSGERLASHSELVVNRLLPYIGSFYNVIEPGRIQGGTNPDWVLQKYLKHVGVTCQKFWLQRLSDDFKLFQERICQIDNLLRSETNAVGLSSLSFVNVIRLPPELLADYSKNNDIDLRPMIHDLLVKERQSSAGRIKKSSERFSEADSAYYEMFNDADSRSNSRPDISFMSQHSFADSGIYEDQVPSVSSCHVDDLDVNSEEAALAENPHHHENVSEEIVCSSGTLCNATSNLVQENDNIVENVYNTRIDDIMVPAINNSNENPSISDNNIETVTSKDTGNCTADGDSAVDNSAHNLSTVARNLEPCLETELSGYDSGISEVDLSTFSSSVDKSNNNVSSVNKTSTPLSVTVYNNIQPLTEKSSKVPKRKNITNLNDDELPYTTKRKCVIRTKWLKTLTTSPRIFENFYARHYIPEDGEEGQEVYDDDDHDEEDNISQHSLVLSHSSNAVDTVSEVVNDSSYLHNSTELFNNTENTNDTDAQADSQSFISPVPHLVESVNNDGGENNRSLNDNIVNASTSGYVCDSHMVSRIKAVSDWRSFIEPKLKELHKSEFDIHHYGGKIMNSIPEGETLPFNDLVHNKKSAEVCRYFLASLQLANTYNIELSAPQGQLANEGFKVKLLTKERYHEHLAEYEAPSENAFREKLARAQAACPSHLLHSTPKISNKKSRKRLKL